MTRWLTLALALLALGCSSSSKDDRAGGAAAPKDAHAPPASAPATATSRFAERVHASVSGLARAAPPASVVPLRWDFSRAREITYDYEQTIDAVANSIVSELHGRGRFDVKVRQPGSADLAITEMVIATSTRDPAGGEPRTHESKAPPLVIQGVLPDGRQKSGGMGEQWYVRALFPFPDGALTVGQSAEIPLSMPFNAAGSMLELRGSARVTLERYVEVDGRRCAQLGTSLTFEGPEVPPELEGTYAASVRGVGATVVDVDRGEVVQAELAAVIDMKVEFPGDVDASAPPTTMHLRQDHYIRLRRRR